jgi:hypothetical protein
MHPFPRRILGALRLDPATYEEVEADRTATGQALLVVLLSAAATGISVFKDGGYSGLLGGTIGAVAGWSVMAWMTWQIGTRFLPEPETSADVGELLRTIGFASSPALLRVFGLLPGAALPVAALTSLWMLASLIVAVRQALDYRSTLRAAVVCLFGFVGYLLVAVAIGLVFGLGAGLIQFHAAGE